jgi:hypothetical protein
MKSFPICFNCYSAFNYNFRNCKIELLYIMAVNFVTAIEFCHLNAISTEFNQSAYYSLLL